MAKSKIGKANEKIEEIATGACENIESGVTGAFARIESGGVGGCKRIEDAFVDQFLAREGESVEEAKERLRQSGRPQV